MLSLSTSTLYAEPADTAPPGPVGAAPDAGAPAGRLSPERSIAPGRLKGCCVMASSYGDPPHPRPPVVEQRAKRRPGGRAASQASDQSGPEPNRRSSSERSDVPVVER